MADPVGPDPFAASLPSPPAGLSAAIGLLNDPPPGPAAPDFTPTRIPPDPPAHAYTAQNSACPPTHPSSHPHPFWSGALRQYHADEHLHAGAYAPSPSHAASMHGYMYPNPQSDYHPHYIALHPAQGGHNYAPAAGMPYASTPPTAGSAYDYTYASQGYPAQHWGGYNYGASTDDLVYAPEAYTHTQLPVAEPSTSAAAIFPVPPVHPSVVSARHGLSGMSAHAARGQGAELAVVSDGPLSYGNQAVPETSGTGRYSAPTAAAAPGRRDERSASVGIVGSGAMALEGRGEAEVGVDLVHRATMESVHTIEGESPRAAGLDRAFERRETGCILAELHMPQHLRSDMIGFRAVGDGQFSGSEISMKRLVGAEGTMPSSSSLALGDVLDSRQSTESALRNGLALPSRNAASIPIPMPRRASTDVALSARHVVQGKGLAAANVQHATPCSRRSPRLKALRKVFNPTLRSGVPLNTTEQKPVTVDREPSEASPDDTASIPDDIPMGARDAPGILLRQSEAALALVSKTGRGGPKAVGKLRLDSPDGEREASRTRKKQSRSAKGRQASEAVASTVKDSGPAERAPKRRGRPTGRGKDEVSVGTKKKRRAVVASQESVFADIDGNTREKSKVPNLFSDDDEDEVLQARGASVFDEIDRRETGSRVKRVDKRPKRQSLTRQRSVFDEDVGVPKKKWDYDSESENSDDDFFPCQKTAPQKGLRAADRTRKPEVKRKKTVGLSPRKATGARKVSLSQSRASPRKGAIRANTANEVELQRDRTRTPSEDEEETDGDACSPSQGGSQTMSIVVEALPVKKKKATRYPEHLWTRMTSDELSTIRKGFVKYYPTPPSNMHAQGRFEQQYMREMPKAMVEALWKNELKPWSDRWWNFFTMFGDFSREKKKQKPLGKNPTLKQAEVDRWAKEFHAKHGDARIPAKTGNVEPDSTAAGAY